MALIWSAVTSRTWTVSYPWVCGRRGISTLFFESTGAEVMIPSRKGSCATGSGWGSDFEAATEGGGC